MSSGRRSVTNSPRLGLTWKRTSASLLSTRKVAGDWAAEPENARSTSRGRMARLLHRITALGKHWAGYQPAAGCQPALLLAQRQHGVDAGCVTGRREAGGDRDDHQ